MLLSCEVDIVCSAEKLFVWLEHLDSFYPFWHPQHIACTYVRGDGFEPGSVLLCQDYLAGRPRRSRFTIRKVEPGAGVEFGIAPGFSGAYQVRPAGQGSRFRAELRLGLPLPYLGWLQDKIMRRLYGERNAALADRLEEQCLNIKRMAESGWTGLVVVTG